VRLAVARQGDESNVLAAGALDIAAADDTLGIGEQDNLEKHGGRISGCTSLIVAEAGIEAREIKFMVNQVVHGMFESAGKSCLCRSTARNRGLVSMCL
jgi:hypothetical protein